MHSVEFQIVRTTDPRAPFFWRMVDDSGHLLTYSSDRFSTVEECRVAIGQIKELAASARITLME